MPCRALTPPSHRWRAGCRAQGGAPRARGGGQAAGRGEAAAGCGGPGGAPAVRWRALGVWGGLPVGCAWEPAADRPRRAAEDREEHVCRGARVTKTDPLRALFPCSTQQGTAQARRPGRSALSPHTPFCAPLPSPQQQGEGRAEARLPGRAARGGGGAAAGGGGAAPRRVRCCGRAGPRCAAPCCAGLGWAGLGARRARVMLCGVFVSGRPCCRLPPG